MQQCGNCGHQNRPGIVFCENCGASLIGKLPLSTRALESPSEAKSGEVGIEAVLSSESITQGMATFMPGDSLKLDVEGAAEPMVLEPKAETILGRRDPATGATPDIDLTPFAGYRMGVSRRHAAIRHGEDNTLNIWDLGSSNGTFLNGQRLNAHRPYRLHDGDELRLGQMVLRVHFRPVPAAVQTQAVPTTPARAAKSKPPATEKLKPQPSAPHMAITPPLTVTAPPKAVERPPEAVKVPPAAPATPAASQPPKAAETPPAASAAPQPEVPAPAAPQAEAVPAPAQEAVPADAAPPAPAPQTPADEAAPVTPAEKPAEPPPAPKAAPPAEVTGPNAQNERPGGEAPGPSEQQADESKPDEGSTSP